MSDGTEMAPSINVDVTVRGDLPGAADYARATIAEVAKIAHGPVLYAHVKLTKHDNPALQRPVVAQGNLDVDGRLVRAQADGETARQAIDRLEERLRRRLQQAAEHWEVRRRGESIRIPQHWQSETTARPRPVPSGAGEREIVRRKSFTLAPCTVDEAALEMELLDYDFHLFTEEGTGMASVLYREGPTGYRLSQVAPTSEDQLAPFELPVTISSTPPPCLTVDQATERLHLTGLPFLFFIDAAQGRASVLYRRYDGHYGLITPAG